MTPPVRHLPDDAIGWRGRIDAAGPMAPVWMKTMLARVLADERMDSDSLLCLADAIVEAAEESKRASWVSLERDLRALADLPRMLAPTRAGGFKVEFR